MYKRNYLTYLLMIFVGSYSCLFPDDAQGVWVSSDRGFLHINGTTISNYRLRGTEAAKAMDLECIQSNGTQYFLR